jgi:hypothetical protein
MNASALAVRENEHSELRQAKSLGKVTGNGITQIAFDFGFPDRKPFMPEIDFEECSKGLLGAHDLDIATDFQLAGKPIPFYVSHPAIHGHAFREISSPANYSMFSQAFDDVCAISHNLRNSELSGLLQTYSKVITEYRREARFGRAHR